MGKVANKLRVKATQLPDAIWFGLDRVGQKIENDAKKECPVDDGALRADIKHVVKRDEMEAIIGNTLEYAPYRHEGTGIYAIGGNGRKEVPWRYKDAKGKWHSTKGVRPKRYLLNAIRANQATILKILGEGARSQWMK